MYSYEISPILILMWTVQLWMILPRLLQLWKACGHVDWCFVFRQCGIEKLVIYFPELRLRKWSWSVSSQSSNNDPPTEASTLSPVEKVAVSGEANVDTSKPADLDMQGMTASNIWKYLDSSPPVLTNTNPFMTNSFHPSNPFLFDDEASNGSSDSDSGFGSLNSLHVGSGLTTASVFPVGSDAGYTEEESATSKPHEVGSHLVNACTQTTFPQPTVGSQPSMKSHCSDNSSVEVISGSLMHPSSPSNHFSACIHENHNLSSSSFPCQDQLHADIFPSSRPDNVSSMGEFSGGSGFTHFGQSTIFNDAFITVGGLHCTHHGDTFSSSFDGRCASEEANPPTPSGEEQYRYLSNTAHDNNYACSSNSCSPSVCFPLASDMEHCPSCTAVNVEGNSLPLAASSVSQHDSPFNNLQSPPTTDFIPQSNNVTNISPGSEEPIVHSDLDRANRWQITRDLLRNDPSRSPFNGNIETYLPWKRRISHELSLSLCHPTTALEILVHNTVGHPHEILSQVRTLGDSPEELLKEAWSRLEAKYNHPLLVANTYLQRLYDTPNIPDVESSDPNFLKNVEQMEDLLWQCQRIKGSMTRCSELKMLDTHWGITLIVKKMSTKFQERWESHLLDILIDNDESFPSYRHFVRFLSDYVRAMRGLGHIMAPVSTTSQGSGLCQKLASATKGRRGRRTRPSYTCNIPSLMSIDLSAFSSTQFS